MSFVISCDLSPTILLLLTTFTTIFFDKDLFGDAIAGEDGGHHQHDGKVHSNGIPKQVFVLEVVPRTAIECMNCSCHICESKDVNKAKVDDKKKEGDAIHGASSKVAPHQVATCKLYS